MMKSRSPFLIILVLFAIFSSIGVAQDERAILAGAGFVMGQITLDLAELNSAFSDAGFPELDSRMVIHGVDAELGYVDGFRLGAFGFGNAATTVDEDRISKLSVSYGGGIASYTFFANSTYELSVGVMIGGGRATLMMLDQASQDFADSLNDFNQTHLRRSFALIQPQVNLTLPIGKWLNLRVSGGYFFTLLAGWEQHGVSMPGPPDSLNSLVVQASLEFAWRGAR